MTPSKLAAAKYGMSEATFAEGFAKPAMMRPIMSGTTTVMMMAPIGKSSAMSASALYVVYACQNIFRVCRSVAGRRYFMFCLVIDKPTALVRPQFSVGLAGFDELFVGTFFDDAAIVEHHDPVHVLNGTEPVRDDDGCAILH